MLTKKPPTSYKWKREGERENSPRFLLEKKVGGFFWKQKKRTTPAKECSFLG